MEENLQMAKELNSGATEEEKIRYDLDLATFPRLTVVRTHCNYYKYDRGNT